MRNQVTIFFLPMHSLLTTNSSHTSQRGHISTYYIKMENSSPGNKILKLCQVEIILDEHTDTQESSKTITQ